MSEENEIKAIDLKQGLSIPALTVRNVVVMTNGTVRLYYVDKVDKAESPIAGKSNPNIAEETRVAVEAKRDLNEKRRLENDLASGKGSKRG